MPELKHESSEGDLARELRGKGSGEVSARGAKEQIVAESMSLEQYNNLMESLFIEADKHYHDRLLKSKKQLEQGEITEKSLDELDILAGVE